jgi:hypothetical protein
MDPRGQIGVRERDASYRDGTSMCTHAHSLPLAMSTVPSDGNMSDSDFEEHVVACDRMSGMETNVQVHSLKERPSNTNCIQKELHPTLLTQSYPFLCHHQRNQGQGHQSGWMGIPDWVQVRVSKMRAYAYCKAAPEH